MQPGVIVTRKLDIYLPTTKGDRPVPAAVYVHGGGWRNGNQTSGGRMTDVTAELVKRGYVVVAVDYRLSPDHHWPAPRIPTDARGVCGPVPPNRSNSAVLLRMRHSLRQS